MHQSLVHFQKVILLPRFAGPVIVNENLRLTRPAPFLFHPWWAHLGSNQGPTGYEPVALPIELWALSGMNPALSSEAY